jgi:CheY-like chemotaxis protein
MARVSIIDDHPASRERMTHHPLQATGHATIEASDADGARAPVVAVTASAMAGDREKIFEAGVDGDVPEPIDAATFVSPLQPFLARRGEHKG